LKNYYPIQMGKRNLKNKYKKRNNKKEFDLDKEEYPQEEGFRIDEAYLIMQKVSE
jgi:hypothetical protein